MEKTGKAFLFVLLFVVSLFCLQNKTVSFFIGPVLPPYRPPPIQRLDKATISLKGLPEENPDKRGKGNWTDEALSGNSKIELPLEKVSRQFFKVNHWDRLVKNVDCQALIRGDEEKHGRTEDIETKRLTVKDYMNITNNCESFKSSSGYITLPVNAEEQNFPLAFSLLVFKGVGQVERLLRAIYRPQNIYCIHVDNKSDLQFKDAIDAIAGCFDNVYIVPNPSAVLWGMFTVLEPELKCMKLLWTKNKWKYFINLTGMEFPLKTNLELVRILHAFNGANNVDVDLRRDFNFRWIKAGPAPHGIQPTKGSVQVVVSRGYVDYLLHNPISKDLLEWVKNTLIPDETYFTTLNYNPRLGVPGSYTGDVEHNQLLARYKVWTWSPEVCHGIYSRSVCVFGEGDLPNLTSVPHLFANKFYDTYQRYTLDCLEEWHFNKTRQELIHPSTLNETFYQELPFVKFATRPGNVTLA